MSAKPKPKVRVKPHSYQPSKAELEADVSVDATPEEIAKAMAPRRIAQIRSLTVKVGYFRI